MARRAGRLVVGVQLTREAVRAGKATVILIAEDLASSRRDRLVERWREAGVPLSRGWTKDELGEIAGKTAVAVLAVTDPHMASGILELESRATASAARAAANEPDGGSAASEGTDPDPGPSSEREE